jgi:hypothetical protein
LRPEQRLRLKQTRRSALTELVQPLAAEPSDVTRELEHRHAPSFTELVYAHFRWWRSLHDGGGDTAGYQRVRGQFEAHHGPVVHAFWCSHVESAVALTERPRRHRWSRHRLGFHRESDWATKGHPEIAAELHRCDELAVRAETVLTGVRQRICLQLVAASAAHLLSLVDAASEHGKDVARDAALRRERAAIDKAAEYYRHAANGQAQIAYFAGMASVAGAIALVSGLALSLDWTTGVAALVAGAVGAVVSVVQRINAGDFELEYDVGRPYAFFLGGLRPLIGGAFALAIAFAFTSGITHLPLDAGEPASHRHLAIVVVSFLAGFSERWAQDTLATALPERKTPPAAQPAETTTTEGEQQ